LHAKTAVFDRKITFVGSFNLDPRSVNLNTEMGLLVVSDALGNSWQVVLKGDGVRANLSPRQ
jgi:putative cardiolipin synthase